jgi:flavin-binding protein dodecin
VSVVKVIKVTASSEKSFADAVVHCVHEVSKTIHNIESIYITDFRIYVKNWKAVSYKIICNVSFRVNDVNSYSKKINL